METQALEMGSRPFYLVGRECNSPKFPACSWDGNEFQNQSGKGSGTKIKSATGSRRDLMQKMCQEDKGNFPQGLRVPEFGIDYGNKIPVPQLIHSMNDCNGTVCVEDWGMNNMSNVFDEQFYQVEIGQKYKKDRMNQSNHTEIEFYQMEIIILTLSLLIHMGNNCIATTPNQIYSNYLTTINSGQLKDLWQTAKDYKIKLIFQSHSQPHPQETRKTILPYESFVNMFPQLDRYEENHKKRLFQIFDFQNQGFIDWNNFFTTISICYFAPEQTLAVFMFMIFDQALLQQLNRDQLQLLLELNSFALKNTKENESDTEIDKIADEILEQKMQLTIQRWVSEAKNYFDLSKYRRLFNIFKEEKLEKELVLNFNDWNELYNETSEKYVSYVVCYKWFEGWKIYVEDHYGVIINVNSLRQATCRAMKTKKTLGKKQMRTMRRIFTSKTIRIMESVNLREDENNDDEDDDERYAPKNIDFIHCNIGERPREIYNNVLQGEFQQVLKPELVENRDYVLVAERVWNSLKQIYGGGPEFRRTGFDAVELYPKIIKIYSSLFNNQIDYSSEVLREVSSYLTVEELLTRSIDIQKQDLTNKKIYYKTIGMLKWQPIPQLDYMFSELTTDVVIFMVYLDPAEDQIFKKNHIKIPKHVSEINAGDYLQFTDPQTKIEKQAVFMGKNIEGKYIIHFPKQPYSLDKCLVQSDAVKYCKINTTDTIVNEVKLKNKIQTQFKGIPNGKGLGFVNSIILNLFNNKHFKNVISMININDEDTKMLHFLTSVYQTLLQKKTVDVRDIHDMLELFMVQYQNFQVSMSEDFLRDFFSELMEELSEMKMQKKVEDSVKISIKSSKKCLKCLTELKDEVEDYCISIPLPIQTQYVYQIVFVPICTGFRSTEVKKFGVVLPRNATLKQLKKEFQKIAELDKKRQYILAEVYSNRIIKNYHEVQLDTPLQKLKLRNGDSIYAFQLYIDFNKFVSIHYSTNKSLSMKDAKVDSFIDCRHNEKGWIFGKVCEIEYLPYTQQTLVKLLHKFSKDEQWEVKYDFSDQKVARFPTKCYLNAEHYHVQLLQRYFNESVNEMQVCSIPLVIVLTNWMRWKEFVYLIYLQLKRFVSSSHEFEDLDEEDAQDIENLRLNSYRDLNGKSSKKLNSMKANKFKEYLNSPNFPYKVHLTDSEGRCAICFKFLKIKIFKGEGDSYCEGCKLSQSQPITWQIKVADIVVCVDWKGFGWWRNDIIKQHSSLINLLDTKKKVVETLENCIKRRFDPVIEDDELLCCNRLEKVQTKEWLQTSPQIIPIFLSRITEEEDGFKKINTNPVTYPLKNLMLAKQKFGLIGVTAIEGNTKNLKYKTFIKRDRNGGGLLPSVGEKKEDEWVQFDGEHTRVVSEKIVQNACALVLFYKKQTKSA